MKTTARPSLPAWLASVRPHAVAPGVRINHPVSLVQLAIWVRRYVSHSLRSDMHRGGGHKAVRRAGMAFRYGRASIGEGYVGGVSPRKFLGLA